MPNKRYNFTPGSKGAENVKRNKENARRKSQATAKPAPTDCQSERDRKFCLTTYINPAELETFLINQPWIAHWCYTSHDRDINDEGNTKDFHTHVLLYTYCQKTSSGVKKNFDRYAKEICKEGEEPQNTLCQICHDMGSQYRYQLHLDNSEKVRYSENERYVDDALWWNKLEKTDGMTDQDNTCVSVISDIRRGASSLELAERYGKDYVYHIHHYEKFFARMSREEMLRNNLGTTIDEQFSLLLEGSNIPQERKDAFFECLMYIKQECIFTYNAKLGFYLQDEEKVKG